MGHKHNDMEKRDWMITVICYITLGTIVIGCKMEGLAGDIYYFMIIGSKQQPSGIMLVVLC